MMISSWPRMCRFQSRSGQQPPWPDPWRKLIQLLEQGVLTEEEYAVAKTKLLG